MIELTDYRKYECGNFAVYCKVPTYGVGTIYFANNHTEKDIKELIQCVNNAQSDNKAARLLSVKKLSEIRKPFRSAEIHLESSRETLWFDNYLSEISKI